MNKCFCGNEASTGFSDGKGKTFMLCDDCLSMVERRSSEPDRLSTVPESLWMDVYRDVIRPDYFPVFYSSAAIQDKPTETRDEIAAASASQAVDHFRAKFPEWK